MTPGLQHFLDDLAYLFVNEHIKNALAPYKEVLRNISYIYPVELTEIVQYFNKEVNRLRENNETR